MLSDTEGRNTGELYMWMTGPSNSNDFTKSPIINGEKVEAFYYVPLACKV